MEVQSTVEQLENLIRTRNIMLVRRAPLGCISYVNGEIYKKGLEAKNRITDFALEYVMDIAGSVTGRR